MTDLSINRWMVHGSCLMARASSAMMCGLWATGYDLLIIDLWIAGPENQPIIGRGLQGNASRALETNAGTTAKQEFGCRLHYALWRPLNGFAYKRQAPPPAPTWTGTTQTRPMRPKAKPPRSNRTPPQNHSSIDEQITWYDSLQLFGYYATKRSGSYGN